ncbi:hypothetical protein C5P18_24250, partial [Escherichia coli]
MIDTTYRRSSSLYCHQTTDRIGTVILHFEARISTFPPFLSGGDMFQKIKIRKMTISRALD